MIFEREDNKLRIILPELLPHRPQLDMNTKTIKYYYDIDKWRAAYYEAFQKEFMNGKYKLFDEKVVIVFLHHVTPGNKPDIDNLDTKVIIDIITLFLLYDDEHNYLCHYMDMIEDKMNYTEILICPQRELVNYIIN